MAATNVRWQIVLVGTAGASLLVAVPSLAFPAATVGTLLAAVRRWQQKRRMADQLVTDAAMLCDLVTIALTGGLGLRASLALAASGVGGDLEQEVAALLRRAQVDGMATAMSEAAGAGKRLYGVLARASATGAEIGEAARRLADEMNAEQAAGRLEAVRKVPVLMLFPLTMLILPGFLLLAIAPAIIEAFSRLDF
jgi:Flp pilus assembly protein TadB